MADVLDVVALDAAGDPVQVIDLNDMVRFFLVAGSFQITPPAKQQGKSATDRRYGGARQTSETHDNGQIGWRALVRGGDADQVIANVSAALGVLERIPGNLFVRWVPDGSSVESFYEIRSTGMWAPEYQWAQFAGARSMVVSFAWEVAPLARTRRIAMDLGEVTLPAVLSLPEAVPGDAPALADVTITTGDGTGTEAWWGLFAWASRPVDGLAPAPFGLLMAADARNLLNWTYNATFGDLRPSMTPTPAGMYMAHWIVDPARMVADSWGDELGVEVWAYVGTNPGLVTPTLRVSALPEHGPDFGSARPTEEPERLVNLPVGATVWRWTRLGTLRLAVDRLRPRRWVLRLEGPIGPGSTGFWAVRALMCVPVQARACGPTSVPGDDTYPVFIPSNAPTEKTVRSDLSAVIGRPGLHGHPHHGLGGQLVELPPGDVDLVAALSYLVPDDPRALSAGDGLFGVRRARIRLLITPRWHLLGVNS